MTIMKASELRIGNFVKEGHKEIVQIDRNYFEFLLNNPSHFNNQVSGIELTEEWLLKFGGVKRDKYEENYLFEFMRSSFLLEHEGNNEHTVYIAGDEITTIKHVHQLQNLYFALTGKELELKNSHEINNRNFSCNTNNNSINLECD